MEKKFSAINQIDYDAGFIGNYIFIKIDNALNTIKLREDILKTINDYIKNG